MTFALSFLFLNHSSAQKKTKWSATDVLIRVHEKLKPLKSLSYHLSRELSYSSDGYHRIETGNVFFDFSGDNPVLGFKYQFGNDLMHDTFNGSEEFILNKKNKTMALNLKPMTMTSKSFFLNSIVTLQKALPAIISDSTIHKTLGDTTLNDTAYHLVKFALYKKAIEPLGEFSVFTADRSTIYQILIDKSNFLPRQVLQGNNVNKDFIKTDFTQIETAGRYPSEMSWYYSTYANDYKLTEKKKLKLIQTGVLAPGWTLPDYKTNKLITTDQLAGKLTMLAFWIKNCGYCIAAVPQLNEMAAKYKGKKLELFAINTHDTREEIQFFAKRNRAEYPILYQGNQVAEAFGVDRFPVIVLIDRSGKVCYSGPFDKTTLEKLIDQDL